MKIISTYAGHESSISVYDNDKITIIELDKLTGEKYFSLGKVSAVEQSEIIEQALETIDVDNDFDMWINGSYHQRRNGTLEEKKMENIINYKRTVYGPGHHLCQLSDHILRTTSARSFGVILYVCVDIDFRSRFH